MSKEDQENAAREIEAKAKEASGDLEEMLMVLDDMAERRRKDPVIEARYEELRDDVAQKLLADGPRFYLDSRGVKRFAFAVQPEPVEIDLDVLVGFYNVGEISEQDFEALCPRRVDKEVFRRLASKGTLPKKIVARSAKLRKGTAHVRFSDPYDASA